ncbi:MAG: hypothetical protein MJZ93_06465 [Paludibacteraceae bacterium]|nr:hypothetical protein [Paludibacteraceae bacterium]
MADCIFRRKLYDKLPDWKYESKGESALLIEGIKCIFLENLWLCAEKAVIL